MRRRLVLFIALGLAVAGPAAAQAEPDTAATIAVIRLEKQAIVEQTMEITSTQAGKFWPLYLEYENARRGISDRMAALIDNYLAQYDRLTNDYAETVLADYLAIEQDRLKLKKQYIKKFRKVLTARQTARFFQLENKLEAMIRAELATEIPLVR
jgi:hypothetical protein